MNIKIHENYGMMPIVQVKSICLFVISCTVFKLPIHSFFLSLLLSIGCFVEACDPDKMSPSSNITDICKLNKNVIDIRNKTDDLMKCFNTSDTKVGNNCIDCLKEFNLIANQYKQFGESSKGICFDVVDQVK